eukprot:m.163727 g.163727  ORF g.163727 m.163727 type:complete len:593 (-) comp12330_c0_seq1:102-1880(-)
MMKAMCYLAAIAVCATAQQPAIVSDTQLNMNINAPGGDINLNAQGTTCSASSLCQLSGRIAALEQLVSVNISTLSSQLAAAVVRADASRLALSNQITSNTNANAAINQVVAQIRNPPRYSVQVSSGNTATLTLGSFNSTNPVVRLDVTASGCGSTTSAVVTLTTMTNPNADSSVSATPFSVVAMVFWPNGTRADGNSFFDVMYQQPSNTNVLWLGLTAYPLVACSGGGTTTLTTTVSTSQGFFTPSTSPPSGGTWQTAASQYVGQQARYAQGLSESILGCQRSGLVYNPSSASCVSPTVVFNNGVTEVVNTIAIASTGSATEINALTVSATGTGGVVGHAEYYCVTSTGNPVTYTAVLSLTPSSGGSLLEALTPVDSSASSTSSQMVWRPPPSGATAPWVLNFTAQPGQECVTRVRYWNASIGLGRAISLVNPSFEQGASGWRYLSGGCGFWSGWTNTRHYAVAEQAAFDGNVVMYCNGQGRLEQATSVTWQPQRTYTMTFWAFKRLDHVFGGYQAALCAGTCATSANVLNSTASNAQNGFAFVPTAPWRQAQQVTLTYTTGTSVPTTGPLTVMVGGYRIQTNFDNVQVYAA